MEKVEEGRMRRERRDQRALNLPASEAIATKRPLAGPRGSLKVRVEWTRGPDTGGAEEGAMSCCSFLSIHEIMALCCPGESAGCTWTAGMSKRHNTGKRNRDQSNKDKGNLDRQ